MENIKSRELTNENLLPAVVKALSKSYTELSFEVGAMGLAQLQDYMDKHFDVDLGHGFDDNAQDIRDAILAHHESLPSGEDIIREATDEDLWPLCETLIERYDISLESRVDLSTRNRVWLVDADGLRVFGESPRQAILRYYVLIKLGEEFTF